MSEICGRCQQPLSQHAHGDRDPTDWVCPDPAAKTIEHVVDQWADAAHRLGHLQRKYDRLREASAGLLRFTRDLHRDDCEKVTSDQADAEWQAACRVNPILRAVCRALAADEDSPPAREYTDLGTEAVGNMKFAQDLRSHCVRCRGFVPSGTGVVCPDCLGGDSPPAVESCRGQSDAPSIKPGEGCATAHPRPA